METNNISNKIKELRKDRGYSQRRLGTLSGVSHATISRIEEGTQKPEIDTLKKLSYVLNCNFEELMDSAGYLDAIKKSAVNESISKYIANSTVEENEKITFIPVVGVISAVGPALAEENIIGYETLPGELCGESAKYFGFKVSGNSMNNSRIYDGDITIVRKQSNVENGEIALVLVGNENATVTKVYFYEDIVNLIPNSSDPKFQPQIIDKSKIPFEIIGKVVRNVIKY